VYAAMMESMDAAVGQVLAKLDDQGLADNTVVCFTSDNGGLSTSEGSPTSNLPFRGGKGWLYEGGIRVPYLIRWPGVTAPGSTCDVPVCSIDFLPTLLETAGASEHAGEVVDGQSLVPLLKSARADESGAWNEPTLFWHYPHYSNQGGFPGVRSGTEIGSSSSATRTAACTCSTWRTIRSSSRTSPSRSPRSRRTCGTGCTHGMEKWARSSCRRKTVANPGGLEFQCRGNSSASVAMSL
jgi:hypothetical protein